MSLSKVNYVDGVTVITAENMNDIQDAIIALQSGGIGGVTSVNGKKGVVVLTASDIGAGTYSKPSGGIPKSDLASAVQTSLGKADTALQSVPSSYRTAAAQDVIDNNKIGKDDSVIFVNMFANGNSVTCTMGYADIYLLFSTQQKTYFVLANSQTDVQVFTIDRVDVGNRKIYLSSIVGGVLSQIVLTPRGSSTMTGTLTTIDLNLQNASGVSF